jgi:hypothetical protein
MRHNVKPAPPVTVCNNVIDAEGLVNNYSSIISFPSDGTVNNKEMFRKTEET